MATINRADAMEAEPSRRHRQRLNKASAARARQLELEQWMESEQEALLPRPRASLNRRPEAGDADCDRWLMEEQEPQDWIDAEQEARRQLRIGSDGSR